MKHSREVYADSGFDRNDCAVRAVATAGCIDYAEAFEAFARHGRKPRHGTKLRTTALVLRELFGVELLRLPCDQVTLKRFLELQPKGHYVVLTCNHAFAICDGTVYDWSLRTRCRIKWFAKLA